MKPPIAPNVITAARLPLAPLAVASLMYGGTAGILGAAFLALLLELTDLADGWLARSYEAVTDVGKLFDPFADAFCRFTLFVGLYAVGQADVWMILAIYYRDSTISFLRSIAATRQIVLAARPSGKLKAVVQGVGTQICFLSMAVAAWMPDQTWLLSVPWWTMLFITVVTLGSLVDYLAGNRILLNDAFFPDAPA